MQAGSVYHPVNLYPFLDGSEGRSTKVLPNSTDLFISSTKRDISRVPSMNLTFISSPGPSPSGITSMDFESDSPFPDVTFCVT